MPTSFGISIKKGSIVDFYDNGNLKQYTLDNEVDLPCGASLKKGSKVEMLPILNDISRRRRKR